MLGFYVVGQTALAAKPPGRKFSLAMAYASFVFTGFTAVFTKFMHLTMSVGAFALAGKTTARLVVFPVAYTAFSLAGKTTARAISAAIAYGTFALTGKTTSRALIFPVSFVSFVLTGFTSFRGVVLITAYGQFVVTGIVNILADLSAPVTKYKIRLSSYVLQQTRQTQPALPK